MTTRNKAAADAPPMEGQTAWTNTGSLPRPEPQESEAERKASEIVLRRLRETNAFPATTVQPVNDTVTRGSPTVDVSNAGGKPAKGKGPRKPRSPARAAVYVERIIMGYTLEQRRAIYAMLSAVCEPTLTDGAEQP